MSVTRIDTYCATDPGPKQWVAILQVMEPDKDGKLHVGVSMNFWAASEADCRYLALVWWDSEVERARSKDSAILASQKRLTDMWEAKRA